MDKTQGNPRPIGRFDATQTTNEAVCTNCFFLDPNTNGLTNEGATQITMEQVQSGEVCWKLNGDQTNIQWFQEIGNDECPLPFPGARVAQDENGGYYNAIQNIAADKALDNSIYNLMGQKVEQTRKGIYITNGKKVLFK